MSFGKRGTYGNKKVDLLNKKIPENPRYAHIKPTVDTGASVSSYIRHLDEIKQNYRYRKDEIFKRLKVTTFVQLVLQIEMYSDAEEKENGVIPQPPREESFSAEPDSPPDTARSTLSSVISGIGEMDVKQQTSPIHIAPVEQATPLPPLPYLLLDVRDRDEYDCGHIVTAKSYPATMLSRSCNYFTKDILDYKNKPGVIIIVYDEDERTAPQVATTFIQRGVDNIFMLSGGMKVLHKSFPDCMITGRLPSSCLQSPPNSARSSSGARRQPLSSSLSSRGPQRTTPRPLANNTTLPETKHRERFTEEDLDKMQVFLDDALMSGSGSSRASSRSSSSTHLSKQNSAGSVALSKQNSSGSIASTSSRASSTTATNSRASSAIWKY